MRINKKLIKFPKNKISKKELYNKKYNNSSYLSANLQCRLGNNLFQIACVISLCQKYELVPIFQNWKYEKIFNIKAKFDDNLFNSINWNLYNEKNHDFHEIIINPPCKLNGWFQSYKYINNKNIISFNEEHIFDIKKKYSSLLSQKNCSIHVRKTDYVGDNRFYEIPLKYYENLYNKLYKLNDNFLIFSDDINWCQNNMNWNKCIFVHENDYEDLYLISQCQTNIISNSTFSWWGAFLGENNRVYCNHKWFNDFPSKGSDICCPHWIKED